MLDILVGYKKRTKTFAKVIAISLLYREEQTWQKISKEIRHLDHLKILRISYVQIEIKDALRKGQDYPVTYVGKIILE